MGRTVPRSSTGACPMSKGAWYIPLDRLNVMLGIKEAKITYVSIVPDAQSDTVRIVVEHPDIPESSPIVRISPRFYKGRLKDWGTG